MTPDLRKKGVFGTSFPKPGIFPEDLSEVSVYPEMSIKLHRPAATEEALFQSKVFPWPSFFGMTQRDFLMKEVVELHFLAFMTDRPDEACRRFSFFFFFFFFSGVYLGSSWHRRSISIP